MAFCDVHRPSACRTLRLAGVIVGMAAVSGVARAQSGVTASDAVPPATSPASPAEIQPGHALRPSTGGLAASPQTATPAPLPPGAGADTPGGAAHDGVIKPPPVAGDQEINRGVPGGAALGTPIIPPPGSPGGNPNIVPK